MSSPGVGNVKVVARVRPFNSRELKLKAKCVVQINDNRISVTPIDVKSGNKSVKDTKVFTFDHAYWSFDVNDANFAGQDALFEDLGKPLLTNAFMGYNNCIFAYGQTGSGKSYSMMGYADEPGIIPRICHDMFRRINELEKDSTVKCTVEVSYLEIYQERVRDLLNPTLRGNLRVREHPSTGPYVEDLAKLVVRSYEEVQNLMGEGSKARTVAATNMNETSSRSHAVFTLTLTQKRHDLLTKLDTEKVAKISLVDLAGSERASFSGATGMRLREGAEINRSLSTLGRVIAALADISTGKKAKNTLVPYRDSVLTWLLKDSLGGNSLTAMVAAISPADVNIDETLSTLRYADSAKRIRNHAIINEDPNARMIRELKEELAELRAKLSTSENGGHMEEMTKTDVEIDARDGVSDRQMVSLRLMDGTVKKVSKAEIAERLNQSEKLYLDLNQTWEEKLQKTKQIHKQREAALEELGISIEKGFIGLSTPKKMPHLVNLSDDPLLTECLVYNLKPGVTKVGNLDVTDKSEEEERVESEEEETEVSPNESRGETRTEPGIRLKGVNILEDHCSFQNVNGAVTIVPKQGASVMVNGMRIESPKRLHSGYRIVLGDFHIFRFNHPQEARAERAEQTGNTRRQSSSGGYGGGSGSHVWSDSHTTVRSTSPRLGWESSVREGDSDSAEGYGSRVNSFVSTFGDKITYDGTEKLKELGQEDTTTTSDSSHDDPYWQNLRRPSISMEMEVFVDANQGEVKQDEDEEGDGNGDGENDRIVLQSDKATESKDSNEQIDTNIEFNMAKEQQLSMALKDEMNKIWLNDQQGGVEQDDGINNDEFHMFKRSMEQRQRELAEVVIERWKKRRIVNLVKVMQKNRALLKEAQILTQRLSDFIVLQFCIVDEGFTGNTSGYDGILGRIGVDEEEDEERIRLMNKPIIGIRVIDFKHRVIRVWSLAKLRKCIHIMRQVEQYALTRNMAKHFCMESVYKDEFSGRFSKIGEVDIPLDTVFHYKVEDYTLEVISPFTFNVIGMIRVSLEPSNDDEWARSATVGGELNSREYVKFDVVLHDFIGFTEDEGTDVHAELTLWTKWNEWLEMQGIGRTGLFRNFGDAALRLSSVHTWTLSVDYANQVSVKVGIFARVTHNHLEKLTAWDDIRDPARYQRHSNMEKVLLEQRGCACLSYTSPSMPTTWRYTEGPCDCHQDYYYVMTRLQIQEICEDGVYRSIEHDSRSETYEFCQGLPRRILIDLMGYGWGELEVCDIDKAKVHAFRTIDVNGNIWYADDDTSPSPPPPPPPLLRQSACYRSARNAKSQFSIRSSVYSESNCGDGDEWSTVDDIFPRDDGTVDQRTEGLGQSSPGHTTFSITGSKVSKGAERMKLHKIMSKARSSVTGNMVISSVWQWDTSMHDHSLINCTTLPNVVIAAKVSWTVKAKYSTSGYFNLHFSRDIYFRVGSRSDVKPNPHNINTPVPYCTRGTSGRFSNLLSRIWRVRNANNVLDTQRYAKRVLCAYFAVNVGSQHDLATTQKNGISSPDPDFVPCTTHISTDYVTDQENLINWCPRGASLLHDYIQCTERRQLSRIINTVPCRYGSGLIKRIIHGSPGPFDNFVGNSSNEQQFTPRLTPRQVHLLRVILKLWTRKSIQLSDSTMVAIRAAKSQSSGKACSIFPLTPHVNYSSITRSAYLYMPNSVANAWLARFVYICNSFLHIHYHSISAVSSPLTAFSESSKSPRPPSSQHGDDVYFGEKIVIINLCHSVVHADLPPDSVSALYPKLALPSNLAFFSIQVSKTGMFLFASTAANFMRDWLTALGSVATISQD